MANNPKNNPIRIDTVGSVTTNRQIITGINVTPSAGSWVADIYASGANFGTRLFYAKGSTATSYGLPMGKPKPTQGLYAVTLDNIAEVDIYIDASDPD